MERIEGRTAFVTGAASGIGLAIAETLISAGAKVVLSDLNASELRTQAGRLGSRAASFALDVVDRDAWPEARNFAEAWGGPVDILVNNAGIGPNLQPLVDMNPHAFDQLVGIKLDGAFNGIQTFGPSMRERGVGHIVNTASMAGLTVTPRLGAYTTAMFGLVGMSEVLRAELAPFGVGVSVLCPGRIVTQLAATTRAVTGESNPASQPYDTTPMPSSPSRAALDAAVVGALVIEGIRRDEPYILTHGEYLEIVERRSQALAAAFRDVPVRG